MFAALLPILGVALGAVGAGVQTFGAMKQADAAKETAKLEMQAEAIRKEAMEADNRRRTKEALRNMQRARAMSLAAATSQGAQYGSAVPGAYGQIYGQTGVNLLGLSGALEMGQNMFNVNEQISAQKMQMADAGSMMSMGQGLSSLGGSVMQSVPAFKSLSGGGLSNVFGGSIFS